MKHLVDFSLFEAALPKLDWDKIEKMSGSKQDSKSRQNSIKKTNDWFSSTLLADPESWKKKYKSDLPTSSIKMASGKTKTVTYDTGWSDLVAGAVSLGKGIGNKLFGKADTSGVKPREEFSNPEHQRLFMDTIDKKIGGLGSENEFNNWARQEYVNRGVTPGESPDFDDTMRASYMKWNSLKRPRNPQIRTRTISPGGISI